MSADRSRRMRALRPLRSRDYRLLFAAVGAQVFGTGMWTIVMVFQVLALNDSPLALSAVATGLSLGLFTFAVVGGVVADRFSKRSILIVVQGVTAAVMTAVAALSLSSSVELWHLGAASFALGAGSAFFYPAYSAYLPQVLPAEELLAANGLEGALRPSVGQGLGPALGGIIVGATVPAIGAAVVALAHAVAFVVVLFLSRRDDADPGAEPVARTSIWDDLRAGVSYVAKTRWLLWTLIFGSSLALIIQGPIEVLLPFLTRDRFTDPEATFGLLLAAFGIGGAVGSLVMSSLRLPRRYLTCMIACWGGGTIPLVAVGLVNDLWVMLAALVLVGAATGAGVVIWGTLLQRMVPPTMIGRVASLDFFVSIAFMPVSIAIAGPISLVVPTEVIFVVAGLAPPALGLLALIAGRMRGLEVTRPLDV